MISGALPISKQDIKFAKITFPILAKCNLQELIIICDGMNEKDKQQIRNLLKNAKYDIHLFDYSLEWKNRIAGVFHEAYSLCKGNLIFSLASDIITDPGMFKRFNSDLISFKYKDYTFKKVNIHENYVNMIRNLPFIYIANGVRWSGVFAMKKKVYDKIQFRDVSGPDLDFFERTLKFYSHSYVKNLNIFHLRSGTNKNKQLEQGMHRAKTKVKPFKVLAHSIFYLKPYLMVGYLKYLL